MKYKDWLREWLRNFVKPSVKARTLNRYENIVNLHIIPTLGNYYLNELSPILLQQFITQTLANGNVKTHSALSANSVSMIISVLQNSLKTAHTLGLIAEYNADKIKRPRLTEKQIECFSLQEQKQIESYVLNSKKDKLFGIVLCLYSGLRIGELLALTWEDLDLIKGVMTVNKSCHDGKHGLVIDAPKTANSQRIIPLPKQLLPALKELKRNSKCAHVVSSDGKPVGVRSYQRSFELLLKKLQIPHRGFHSLRHTFATRALECGMDVKTLAEILGHKNPTVTLKRYAHSLMEHKAEMMNRLGKLF